MKPRYAPELEELIRIKDGSIDEAPQDIELRNEEFRDRYRRRQSEFTRQGSQSSYKDKRDKGRDYVRVKRNSNQNKGFLNSLRNDFNTFVDDVKEEIRNELKDK